MPRQKPHPKVYPTDLQRIEDACRSVEHAISHADIGLTPFGIHYNALSELREAMRRAVNILNDRDPDYQEPHRGHGWGLRETGGQ